MSSARSREFDSEPSLVELSLSEILNSEQLLRFWERADRPEFRSVIGGVLHASGGAENNANAFKFDKAAPRAYKVELPNLPVGQCGFLAPGAAASADPASRAKVHTLLVWKVDRLGRKGSLDFTTPAGRLMFNVIGAIQRDLIRERVRSRMANASAPGREVGTKACRSISPRSIGRTEGLSFEAISQRTRLSVGGRVSHYAGVGSGVATITAGKTTLYCAARVRFWVWVVVPDFAVTTIV